MIDLLLSPIFKTESQEEWLKNGQINQSANKQGNKAPFIIKPSKIKDELLGHVADSSTVVNKSRKALTIIC